MKAVVRRHHHRHRTGGSAARETSCRRRDGRSPSSSGRCSAAPASTRGAFRPRQWWRARMRRTWRAGPAISGSCLDGTVRVDMKAVKARKDEISGAVPNGTRELAQDACKTAPSTRATPASNRRRRSASAPTGSPRSKIFINVGGRAVAPPMPGLDQIPYLNNSSMMDVDFLPEHLVVVGGSYIGLEFGQMYRRFGSEVTIIEKGPRLIGREDEDVSAAIQEILEKEGIERPPERRVHQLCEACRRHRRPCGLRRRAAGCYRQPRAAGDRAPAQYRRPGPRRGGRGHG